MRHQMGQLRDQNAELVEQVENAEAQNEDLQEIVDELGLQLQQFQLNQGNNMPLEVNPIEEEEEEEPTEIQGESGIISGPINKPAHDGAYMIPANELSDVESSVNQPILVAPVAYDMILFPEEMLGQVTEATRRHGVDVDHMFAIYPPPRQQMFAQKSVVS